MPSPKTLLESLPSSVQRELKAPEFTVKHPIKAQILRQEEESKDVFFINYGKARVTLYTQHGYKLSFTDIYAGQSFGELSAIDLKPRSANVVATEETSLTRIPYQKFKQLLETYPEFASFVMNHMSAMIRRLNHRLYELSALDGTHRIYAELLRIAEDGEHVGEQVIIYNPPTHAEIASRINSHREAVSRAYNALNDEGILEKKSKKLILTNVDILEQRINIKMAQ